MSKPKNKSDRYPRELRERAVRMGLEQTANVFPLGSPSGQFADPAPLPPGDDSGRKPGILPASGNEFGRLTDGEYRSGVHYWDWGFRVVVCECALKVSEFCLNGAEVRMGHGFVPEPFCNALEGSGCVNREHSIATIRWVVRRHRLKVGGEALSLIAQGLPCFPS